jgi:hypothetical protein
MKNRGRGEWYGRVRRQQNNGEVRSCEVEEHGRIRINWSNDVNTNVEYRALLQGNWRNAVYCGVWKSSWQQQRQKEKKTPRCKKFISVRTLRFSYIDFFLTYFVLTCIQQRGPNIFT